MNSPSFSGHCLFLRYGRSVRVGKWQTPPYRLVAIRRALPFRRGRQNFPTCRSPSRSRPNPMNSNVLSPQKNSWFPVSLLRANVLFSACLLLGALSPGLHAAIMSWDPAGVTTGNMDGNGTWSTTNANWFNRSTAGNLWDNSTADTANFGSAT